LPYCFPYVRQGTVYIGSNNHAFFALSDAAGSWSGANTPLWTFHVNASIPGTAALSWDEATVFIGDKNGTVRVVSPCPA
jgi:hypothetical protein